MHLGSKIDYPMNAKKKERLKDLLDHLEAVISALNKLETAFERDLEKIHPNYKKAAVNLIHYRGLRSKDLRFLQKQLSYLGISRLSKIESHTMASLVAARYYLRTLISNKPVKFKRAKLTFKQSQQQIRANTKALLGYRSKKRRGRIMVTLPSEAADNFDMVFDMISSGMNCARINCAHDSEEEWLKMIENVRKSSKKLGKKCLIAMDLGGPKIRTGPIISGPKVIKFRPVRNMRGATVKPAKVWLAKESIDANTNPLIPVQFSDFEGLVPGGLLYFLDTRDKERSFVIEEKREKAILVSCKDTFYLETGLKVFTDKKLLIPSITIGELPNTETRINLQHGDILHLHKSYIIGTPALHNDQGSVLAEAKISCTLPDVLERIKVGEPVLFDDGKIGGVVIEKDEIKLAIEIQKTRPGGRNLRSDKGINFPKSKLNLSGLTAKDKEDLQFVVKHADVVNMSFVNGKQDVKDLYKALQELGALDKMGVILKIETQHGFNNLLQIILEAMKTYPIGIMIARGDLAVEVGWENIGRVQKEILAITEAGLVPNIWATQVLENLAKKGIPSRAEITDVAEALRADSVMLNKGPFIMDAISLLDQILKNLEPYRDKSKSMYPALEKV